MRRDSFSSSENLEKQRGLLTNEQVAGALMRNRQHATITSPRQFLHNIGAPYLQAKQLQFLDEQFANLFDNSISYVIYLGEYTEKKRLTIDIQSRTIPYEGPQSFEELWTGAKGSLPDSLDAALRVIDQVEMTFFRVWIKLYSNGRCDAGITLLDIQHEDTSELNAFADVLLPSHEDTAAALSHIQTENWRISEMSFSLFKPYAIGISAVPDDINPQLRLSNTFFFYQILGYVRPSDAVISLISNSRPEAFRIQLEFGTQGLLNCTTVLEMRSPVHLEIVALPLAKELGKLEDPLFIHNDKDGLVDAKFLQYGVSALGYTLHVGYSIINPAEADAIVSNALLD